MSQENTQAQEEVKPENVAPVNEENVSAPQAEKTGDGSDTEAPATSEINPEEASATPEEAAVDPEKLQAEVEKYKDQFLRANAEMENIRRRSQNEIVNARKFAVEGFARELLQVQDSLQQASNVTLNENESDAVKQMLEGLQLTCKQLDTVFERFGIEVIAPEKGDKLDPEKHQAMSMQPSDDVAPNHVVNVVQKGYLLKGRLLRPAMVLVAAAK